MQISLNYLPKRKYMLGFSVVYQTSLVKLVMRWEIYLEHYGTNLKDKYLRKFRGGMQRENACNKPSIEPSLNSLWPK